MKEEPVIPLVIKTNNSFLLETELQSSLESLPAFGKEWYRTNPSEIESYYRCKEPAYLPIGSLARIARRRQGLAQAQLAKKAGCLPKTISALEANKGTVSLNYVETILKALDLKLTATQIEGIRVALP